MAGRPYVQVGIGEPPVRMISSLLADERSAMAARGPQDMAVVGR
jgi:hypothetical protein